MEPFMLSGRGHLPLTADHPDDQWTESGPQRWRESGGDAQIPEFIPEG